MINHYFLDRILAYKISNVNDTISETRISVCFCSMSRSIKTSLPSVSPFLTDTPVTTSLSSGLNRQSVLKPGLTSISKVKYVSNQT